MGKKERKYIWSEISLETGKIQLKLSTRVTQDTKLELDFHKGNISIVGFLLLQYYWNHYTKPRCSIIFEHGSEITSWGSWFPLRGHHRFWVWSLGKSEPFAC